MRRHKIISAILHPIVMPTIGVLLYFIFSPVRINIIQQYAILGVVFVATYIVPLLLLFLLKSLGTIRSFEVSTINERKIPIFVMVTIFVVLGKTFFNYAVIRDISYLFYGTALGLIIVYLTFF